MYAIVRTGGKQYRVAEGDVIVLEKISGQAGDPIELKEVLFLSTEEGMHVGAPTVEGGTVKGEIVRQERGKKIIVFKHKRRKGYRKKQGHRQDITRVRIQKIEWGQSSEVLLPAEEGVPFQNEILEEEILEELEG